MSSCVRTVQMTGPNLRHEFLQHRSPARKLLKQQHKGELRLAAWGEIIAGLMTASRRGGWGEAVDVSDARRVKIFRFQPSLLFCR